MRMTQKQIILMTCLADGNPDGTPLDLDQLLERLWGEFRWDTTKASLQFSLRSLLAEDLVEKREREIRRGRKRAVLALTPIGMRVLGR